MKNVQDDKRKGPFMLSFSNLVITSSMPTLERDKQC